MYKFLFNIILLIILLHEYIKYLWWLIEFLDYNKIKQWDYIQKWLPSILFLI